MRDPERIQETLGLIEKLWRKDSDLRFNQLIYNLQWGYSQENGGIGKVEEVVDKGYSRFGFDLLDLEDDSFIEYLRKQVMSEQ